MFPPKSQCVQEAFPLASEYIVESANKYEDALPEGGTDDLEMRRVHVCCPFMTVVLDPPWPNRSARRAGDYKTSYGTKEIKELLGMVPVRETLWEAGYVAVWVTNKAAFREMLLEEGGFFEQWGVQLVEEWTWLKVTAKGEPICKLDSRWRKPYEVLLIGRRTEGVSAAQKAEGVKRRTIVAVPDLHSRKPNLKELLGQLEGVQEGYKGLEVFARNLTSGWDAVGDEACKFQQVHHWIEESTGQSSRTR
jgi:N6-adenosine-specific RNA methylase IME4